MLSGIKAVPCNWYAGSRLFNGNKNQRHPPAIIPAEVGPVHKEDGDGSPKNEASTIPASEMQEGLL